MEGIGTTLPVIPVSAALNTNSDWQLAKTLMSPAKHTLRYCQKSGSRKMGTARLCSPVTPVLCAAKFVSDLQCARIAMSPAENPRN